MADRVYESLFVDANKGFEIQWSTYLDSICQHPGRLTRNIIHLRSQLLDHQADQQLIVDEAGDMTLAPAGQI